jgi:hypothetical protein
VDVAATSRESVCQFTPCDRADAVAQCNRPQLHYRLPHSGLQQRSFQSCPRIEGISEGLVSHWCLPLCSCHHIGHLFSHQQLPLRTRRLKTHRRAASPCLTLNLTSKLPGVSFPWSQLPMALVALAGSMVFHELGHALAASAYCPAPTPPSPPLLICAAKEYQCRELDSLSFSSCLLRSSSWMSPSSSRHPHRDIKHRHTFSPPLPPCTCKSSSNPRRWSLA